MLSRTFVLLTISIVHVPVSYARSINQVTAGFYGGGLGTTLAAIVCNTQAGSDRHREENCAMVAPIGIGITLAGTTWALARCAGYGKPFFPARELKQIMHFYNATRERIDNQSYTRVGALSQWYIRQNPTVRAFLPVALHPRCRAAVRLRSDSVNVHEQLVYLSDIEKEFIHRGDETNEEACMALGSKMVRLGTEINERLKEYGEE